MKHKLYSAKLGWIHAILTVVSFAVITLFCYKASNAYRPNFVDWSTFEKTNDVIVATVIVFAIAQIIMIANVIIGALKIKKLTGRF